VRLLDLPPHLPSTRWTTNTESQAQLPQQHPKLRSQTPNLQNSFPSGVMSHQPTFYPNNICMESTTTEGAPVATFAWSQVQQRERQWQRAYQRRPTPLETQEKTTETEAHSPLATVYACPVPGGRFLVKFGCQPIKLDLHLLVHAHTANCVRVHFRHLGVYKGSRVAY